MTSVELIADKRDRISRLAMEAKSDKAEITELAKSFNEFTGLSWLWAFLFGAIYFAVHGFWGRALIVFVLSIFIVGIFVSPFLTYPAWRKRAEEKAANMVTIDKFRQAR